MPKYGLIVCFSPVITVEWVNISSTGTGSAVGGSIPTAAVLCPWARHFTPRKYWLITQEAVAPSRHDWKIVDWDFKPQHKQTKPVRQKLGVGKWKKIGVLGIQKVAKTGNIGKKTPVAGNIDYVRYISMQN